MTIGSRVRVHFNLHTHLWSITAMEGAKRGRVVEHAAQVALNGCKFIVSEAGRQRVLRDRCRLVHAWVEGRLSAMTQPPEGTFEFTYNPYRAASFTRLDGQPVTSAEACWFIGRRAFANQRTSTNERQRERKDLDYDDFQRRAG